jgi:hypothetical protein
MQLIGDHDFLRLKGSKREDKKEKWRWANREGNRKDEGQEVTGIYERSGGKDTADVRALREAAGREAMDTKMESGAEVWVGETYRRWEGKRLEVDDRVDRDVREMKERRERTGMGGEGRGGDRYGREWRCRERTWDLLFRQFLKTLRSIGIRYLHRYYLSDAQISRRNCAFYTKFVISQFIMYAYRNMRY